MCNNNGFSHSLCQDCAYRKGKRCTLAGANFTSLVECPDGYTVDTARMIMESYFQALKTGRHSKELSDWETKLVGAMYPERSSDGVVTA